jgi:hypothetical protein
MQLHKSHAFRAQQKVRITAGAETNKNKKAARETTKASQPRRRATLAFSSSMYNKRPSSTRNTAPQHPAGGDVSRT